MKLKMLALKEKGRLVNKLLWAMKIMKKYIKILLFVLLINVFIDLLFYCAFVFILLDFNPIHWTLEARSNFLFCLFISICFSPLIFFFINESFYE